MSSSNNGPSGRSPYPPTRSNRRRMSAELPSMEDSTTSPFLISGHGLLRVSPSASAHWSPANNMGGNNNTSARHPRRFFTNSSTEAIGLLQQSQRPKKETTPSAAIPSSIGVGEDNINNHNAGDDKQQSDINDEEDEMMVLDGIYIKKLRSLTKESLGTSNASLPSTAVFYASLLYAKTQSQQDAFLYAQALSRNGEFKRCVRLLEQSATLDPSATEPSLRLEAVLLAAEAMSNLMEWQSVLDLLEDASQLVVNNTEAGIHPSYAPHLYPVEDDDDMAWETFLRSVQSPDNYIHPVSRLCLWRGRAYSETGHPQRAALYWKRAIRMDSKCVQALDFLLTRSVVTPQEAHDVIESLNIEPQMEWLRDLYLARIELSPQDVQFSREKGSDMTSDSMQMDLNVSMQMQHMPDETPFPIKGHSQYIDASSIQMASPSVLQTPHANTNVPPTSGNQKFRYSFGNAKASMGADGQDEQCPPTKPPIQVSVDEAFSKLWRVHKLHQSPEVLAMAARRAYRRYDLRGALQHCQQLASIDPLCLTAGYVYVTTLTALGHKRQLFQLAHDWVEASPKSARAWFAVGSYYYACERFHVAQRHFCRATRLDPHCTEAWIAFGCSFAACDESDQALASFRAAQRLSPGEYASLLYMGMEYSRTNHLVLAQYFLTAAFKASGGDPLCLNELGVLSIQQGDYESAIGWFVRALRASVQDDLASVEHDVSAEECIELCQEEHWEATIFNLGQCYRKTRKFKDAACCFERCIALSPVGFITLLFTSLVSLRESYTLFFSRNFVV